MRALILLPLLVACSGGPASTTPVRSGKVKVKAVSYPAAYLVQRVGGAEVEVENILPAGEDPPSWQPSGDVVARLAEADLIVANGAGYEAWMATATLPTAKVVDTSLGLDLVHVEGPTHSHGKAGEHSHAGTDPHTWGDPAIYAKQAQAVHDALAKVDPANAQLYALHLQGFTRQLDELGAELDATLARAKDHKLAANHPSYTYLARRAGLEIPSLHLDPDEVPSAEVREALATEQPADLVFFWEARPAGEVAGALPATWTTVVLDPLEQPHGESYDYVAQTRINLKLLQQTLDALEAADTDAAGEGGQDDAEGGAPDQDGQLP